MDRERNYQLAKTDFNLWLDEQTQDRQLIFVERALGRLGLDEYPYEGDYMRDEFVAEMVAVSNEAAWSDLFEGMKLHGFAESEVDVDGKLLWFCTPSGEEMLEQLRLDNLGDGG
jgi:hypothetical protein